LKHFEMNERYYSPTVPQIIEKPCEIYEGIEPYVFISYAHDDAYRVYPIIKEIYEAGWDLWYDEGIRITELFLLETANRLKNCVLFVLMLSNRCLERPFIVDYELEYARLCGVPIIPILLEEINSNISNVIKEKIIDTNELFELLNESNCLINKGNRVAEPPAVKQNVIYDVFMPNLPGFEVTIKGNEITIIKYVGEDVIDIVIPETIESDAGDMVFQITAIEEFAFGNDNNSLVSEKHNCESLVCISIPKSIVYIGKGAFMGCKKLKSIMLFAIVNL